jgi:hypothetical protein
MLWKAHGYWAAGMPKTGLSPKNGQLHQVGAALMVCQRSGENVGNKKARMYRAFLFKLILAKFRTQVLLLPRYSAQRRP